MEPSHDAILMITQRTSSTPSSEELVSEAQALTAALRTHERSEGFVWQGLRDHLAATLRDLVALCGEVPLVVIEGSWYTAPVHTNWLDCDCARCELYRRQHLPLQI